MTWRIDPGSLCTTNGCTRPKASHEPVCSSCSRLAGAVGLTEVATLTTSGTATGPRELSSEINEFLEGEPRPPRCIAYLSQSGDVITLELTSEPKFTAADVEAVAAALSSRRKAA